MPEPKKMCPCCSETELEQVKENELYCTKCDLTYSMEKGKATFKSGKKGKVEELELNLADLKMTLEKVIKKLFGEKANEGDFWD